MDDKEVAALRAENERLRAICRQVRKWGIELASTLPDERNALFSRLWPKINEALRDDRREEGK